MLTKSHTNTKKKKNEHEIFNVICWSMWSLRSQRALTFNNPLIKRNKKSETLDKHLLIAIALSRKNKTLK